jgi:hypothetical protein
MKKQISKLIDLKSFITLTITGLLAYGFIVGKINDEKFMMVATMIFTYYFTRKNKIEKGDE